MLILLLFPVSRCALRISYTSQSFGASSCDVSCESDSPNTPSCHNRHPLLPSFQIPFQLRSVFNQCSSVSILISLCSDPGVIRRLCVPPRHHPGNYQRRWTVVCATGQSTSQRRPCDTIIPWIGMGAVHQPVAGPSRQLESLANAHWRVRCIHGKPRIH